MEIDWKSRAEYWEGEAKRLEDENKILRNNIKTYLIGSNMDEKVFKAAGLVDVHDLQAVFDAVETALMDS